MMASGKTKNAKITVLAILILAMLAAAICLTSCGKKEGEKKTYEPPEIEGLTYDAKLEKKYAEDFDVFYYNDGFKVVCVHDSRNYLLVPEGKEAPESVPEDMIVLKKPLKNIYLAASSAMALFDSLDALDTIKFSGTEANDWYIEAAKKAMEKGKIKFAGKYSEPDFERLVDEGCDAAMESQMILHSPEVQEKLEDLGIPVFIDCSSDESHPLGRTEWIKVYGAILDREEQAEKFFDSQAKIVEKLDDFENTEKKVAFFYINQSGQAVVRASRDYIPKMIELAGGRYVFSDLKQAEGSKNASVTMSMEEFYETAQSADYIIYNSTIDAPLRSIKELEQKSELFKDFKAVKEGHVWMTGKYLYQATDIVGQLITDINLMLTDGAEEDMTFLSKVE